MADITMCSGRGCKQRNSCYRFTATACEFRQSYFAQVPMEKNGVCDYFWFTPYSGLTSSSDDDFEPIQQICEEQEIYVEPIPED